MPSTRTDRALQALLLGFAILTLAVLSSIWLAQRQERAFGWVQHTLEVQNRLGTVLSELQDAETGQRGYLLTRQPAFLTPYESAVGRIDADMAGLGAAIADNPEQRAAMMTLRGLSRQRLAILREGLARAAAGRDVGVTDIELLDSGRQVMDRIRLVVAEMRTRETALLARRTRAAEREGAIMVVTLLGSAIASLGLGVFVFRDGRRRVEAANQARDALAFTNDQLRAEAASRQDAESQMRQMQKMEAVGQLTGGIAHDFNNMLAIVLGSLDLAKRRLVKAPERAEACIDNAIEGAERAAQLTGRLLAFSRQQPLAPKVLDVNKLVGGMSELLRRSIGEDVRVETVLAGGVWRAYADPGQLENAILNLCVNARDAMDGGGRLTVETANAHLDDAYADQHSEVDAGQYVMVSITDTGAGMPPEVIERAFDPFYTTKEVGKGTGLGLSQVHGFVKQSGGHVKIYSEIGVGTTVKLYLPRSLSAAETAEGEAAAPVNLPRAQAGEIIFVVEDEAGVRHLTVDALRDLGYTVVQASDGSQALAGIGLQPRIDLLFTDIIMPGMTGRQLADAARQARPDLKVLYTTGYTKNAIVHNGVLDADVAFLPKPFTIEQLALKVRQVLDGRGVNRTS